MKTPIQELIEQMSYNRDRALGAEKDAYNICILYAENMLEKEKEQMCEFAEQYFISFGYKSTEDYFDRAFNTKEK
jgi:hypothetical protein